MTTGIQQVERTEFSTEIREATMDAHRSAERAAFVRELIGGKLSRNQYARLVVQHHAIYSVLEEAAAAMATDATAGGFVRRELDRVAKIEADLEVLIGASWREQPLTDATQAYCDRLREVAFSWGGGFVAHHYVRYLGDLSGGQVILRVLRKSYEIDEQRGATFYGFEDIVDHDAFKRGYRARLDTAAWDRTEQERIIGEVQTAYRLNTAVFESLL